LKIPLKSIKKENKESTSKKTIRRKSCHCKWCGGISEKELRNQDIAPELEKFAKSEPVFVVPTAERNESPSRTRFERRGTQSLASSNN